MSSYTPEHNSADVFIPDPDHHKFAEQFNTDPEHHHGVQVEMVQVVDPKRMAVVKGQPGRPNSDDYRNPNAEENGGLKHDEANGEDDGEISDFDLDLDDREDMDRAMSDANFLEKGVLLLQRGIHASKESLRKVTKGHLNKVLFAIGYIIYFIVAMCYEFDDEGAHRLLVITVFAVAFVLYPYVKKFTVSQSQKMYGSDRLTENHKELRRKCFLVIKWLLYIVMTAFMVYLLVDEGREKPRNMRALPGLFAFLFVCFIFSRRPSKINWHTIFWGVALQFLFAVFVLKWKFGHNSMQWLNSRVHEFFKNAEKASELVFGQSYRDHLIIFGGAPLLLFTNAVFTVLYYLGVMQFIIRSIGRTLQFFLRVSAVEAMSVSATIFLEGVATMVMMRPFMQRLSKSELFTVVNGAISSLGGGYLALLSAIGIPLEHLIPGILISAPATFAVCKLLVPETRELTDEDVENSNHMCAEEKSKYINLVDAAQTGALSMVSVLTGVVVVMYTFFTSMTWVNHTLEWLGDRVGIDGLSIELISSYVLYPFALAMGVSPDDCRRVAMLLGYRLGIYNIVAFVEMLKMKGNRYQYMAYMAATNFTGTITEHRDDITLDAWNKTLVNGFISERSEAIVTYALCGFSSVLGAALLMGVIYTLVPQRKKWITQNAIPAILAGTIANCMTGCFASMFY